MGLRSAARVVAVNAIMLPVYIALLVTGIGTAAAFFIVMAGCSGATWATWSRAVMAMLRR